MRFPRGGRSGRRGYRHHGGPLPGGGPFPLPPTREQAARASASSADRTTVADPARNAEYLRTASSASRRLYVRSSESSDAGFTALPFFDDDTAAAGRCECVRRTYAGFTDRCGAFASLDRAGWRGRVSGPVRPRGQASSAAAAHGQGSSDGAKRRKTLSRRGNARPSHIRRTGRMTAGSRDLRKRRSNDNFHQLISVLISRASVSCGGAVAPTLPVAEKRASSWRDPRAFVPKGALPSRRMDRSIKPRDQTSRFGLGSNALLPRWHLCRDRSDRSLRAASDAERPLRTMGASASGPTRLQATFDFRS